MLLFGSFVLMFAFIAFFYITQEYTRLLKEQELKSQLNYIECMSLKIEDNCSIYQRTNTPNMKNVYTDTVYVFGILLIFIIPISIMLSFFSVRPVRQASAMIDDFIASIVHDINTPISTILLNTKSLIKHSRNTSPKLTRILASSKQLQDMQHDLLALADEKTELNIDEINLKDMIQNIVEDFKLKHSNQTFILNLSEQTIYANQMDMRRIMQNLISNAIKYNIDHNPIRIYNAEHWLTIEDKGRGILRPDKVFDKNYREDYTIEGNGIGLASVLAMLERNHIDIKVSSQPHAGTKIQLNLEKNLYKGFI